MLGLTSAPPSQPRPDSPAAGTFDPESSWGPSGRRQERVPEGHQPRDWDCRCWEELDNPLKESRPPRFARFEKEGCLGSTGPWFSVLGDDLTLMGKGHCWAPGSGLSCPEEAAALSFYHNPLLAKYE